MAVSLLLLSCLSFTIWPAYAQEVQQKSASNLNEYCFYSIYESLTGYTFYDSSSTNSTSTTTATGSTSHGSSSSSGRPSRRLRSKLAKRGHKGSTSTTQCTSSIEAMSLYASAKKWCDKDQFAVVIPYWQSLCEESGVTLLNLTEVIANATSDYIETLPVVAPDIDTTSTLGTITSPILLSESYYKRAYKSYVTHDYALDKDKRYGWGLMGYWAGILFLGMIHRFWSFCFTERQNSQSTTTSHSSIQNGRLGHFLHTHLVIPGAFYPLINNHQRLFYWHSIPRRLDLLIVLGFWFLAIVLSCVNYESFSGNISTPDLFQQNWQYSSDRTGVLSYACLPFMWLFAGRNNIFLWATGFKVQSFNIFHRHIAWVATILAVIHSINYTVVFVVYDGRYKSALLQNYFYMGIVATIVMCLLLAFSITWFRHRYYETFLIIHILFALLTIYALFCHTSYDGLLYNSYLWPLVAIWAFDRMVRYIRVAYCNLNVKLGKDFIKTTSSSVWYDRESDLIVVSLIPAQNQLGLRPGQYYHLYQPITLRGWENHPFTLGGYTLASQRNLDLSTPQDLESRLKEPTGTTLPSEMEQMSGSQPSARLTFYIRPYDGWTKRLRDQCLKSSREVIHPTLLLEGPYGHTHPLHIYDHVLFIVGGTGISAAVPYIQDYLTRSKSGKTRTTHIHLVWTCRQQRMVEILMSSDLSIIKRNKTIKRSFYCSNTPPIAKESEGITSPTCTGSLDSVASSDEAITLAKAGDDTKAEIGIIPTGNKAESSTFFISGRPPIRQIVQDAVEESRSNSSTLAVFTCGPAAMADDCRMAVYLAMKSGVRSIEYFEDSFGW